MAQDYYKAFTDKLKEIFMMDHAELDFGIYRIMNQKRRDIEQFLDRDLLPQVKAALAEAGADTTAIKQRMAEIEKDLGGKIDSLPESIPMVAEYKGLKAKLQMGADTATMQNEVFSHLTTFFSRYYDEGDFVSKRRYKDNTYAIPYNGEEVKLHWANADQYYIKSSEYFRDYTFMLPDTKQKVHFELKDASTEQNNNKAAGNMERRFALWKSADATPFMEERDGELHIYFTYELMPKGTKQDALMADAFAQIRDAGVPEAFTPLLTLKAPTEKNKNRTLLEKHLTDYTAKNQFDYFIHKDLGGFLSRELDFYIKNEVMHLDDLDAALIQRQLSQVKAIKLVGSKIVQMLAQLENFQKRLWLKKKFVVQADYCITLDRVPRRLYADICANSRQREEWVRLFAIDEIKQTTVDTGYSEPLTETFLEQNPFLVLDTAFFSLDFKRKLIASMENIDEECNGLLINSENFQALELLQEKYRERVDCVYIDPPYNTGSDGFVYKDNYPHSSWLSMMNDRLDKSKSLMSECSSIASSINENEVFNLKMLFDNIFNNYYANIAVKVRHEDRILKGDKDFHEVYENLLFYAKNKTFKPLKRKKDNTSIDDYLYEIETNKPDFTLKCGDKEVEVFSPQNYCINKKLIASDKYLKPISIRGSIREGNSSGRFYVSYLEQFKNEYPGYLFKVPEMGDDALGFRYFWLPTIEGKRKNGDYYQGKPLNGKDILEIPYPNCVNYEKEFNDATNEGGIAYRNGKKPIAFLKHVLSLQKVKEKLDAIVLDYFAGSASTGHCVISINKEDNGNRKYLLMQNETIFDTVTCPRIQKVIYSSDWRDGKPVSRDGISQCFKYIRLEQYEDTLNNLALGDAPADLFDQPADFRESYMLSYMLDTETRGSLFDLQKFENPFDVSIKTTRDNELVETPVDMVETFNYLIGLDVETMSWHKDGNICVVEGKTHRRGDKTLVIWRNRKVVDNEQLNAFFEKMDIRTRDSEFDLIYVNGDNTLPNLRRDEDHWKVALIEEEFEKRMFEEN